MPNNVNIEDIYREYTYPKKNPLSILKITVDMINSLDIDKPKILSTACGDGHLEEFVMKAANFEIDAIDGNESGVLNAQKRGINAICGNVYDMPYPDKTYDLILAMNIIEHLTEPIKYFQEVKRLLKTDGKIFMKLPNWGHLYYRLRFLRRGSLNTLYQMTRGHFVFYTFNELIRFIEDIGFVVNKEYTFTYLPWLLSPFVYINKNLFSVSTMILASPTDKVSEKLPDYKL